MLCSVDAMNRALINFQEPHWSTNLRQEKEKDKERNQNYENKLRHF